MRVFTNDGLQWSELSLDTTNNDRKKGTIVTSMGTIAMFRREERTRRQQQQVLQQANSTAAAAAEGAVSRTLRLLHLFTIHRFVLYVAVGCDSIFLYPPFSSFPLFVSFLSPSSSSGCLPKVIPGDKAVRFDSARRNSFPFFFPSATAGCTVRRERYRLCLERDY